jgi:hypothetical protein
MKRRDDEELTYAVKCELKTLNTTLDAKEKVNGIAGLVQLQVGYRNGLRLLYYALDRTLDPMRKQTVVSLLEKAARKFNLVPTPLFS